MGDVISNPERPAAFSGTVRWAAVVGLMFASGAGLAASLLNRATTGVDVRRAGAESAEARHEAAAQTAAGSREDEEPPSPHKAESPSDQASPPAAAARSGGDPADAGAQDRAPTIAAPCFAVPIPLGPFGALGKIVRERALLATPLPGTGPNGAAAGGPPNGGGVTKSAAKPGEVTPVAVSPKTAAPNAKSSPKDRSRQVGSGADSNSAGSHSAQAPAVAGSGVERGLINVNTATAAELELLPNIGPALAKRIIEFRETNGPFRRIEDLDRVKGIGTKTLKVITPLVTVRTLDEGATSKPTEKPTEKPAKK